MKGAEYGQFSAKSFGICGGAVRVDSRARRLNQTRPHGGPVKYLNTVQQLLDCQKSKLTLTRVTIGHRQIRQSDEYTHITAEELQDKILTVLSQGQPLQSRYLSSSKNRSTVREKSRKNTTTCISHHDHDGSYKNVKRPSSRMTTTTK